MIVPENTIWNVYSKEIPSFIQEAASVPEMERLLEVGMNCGMNYTSFPFYGSMEPYSRYEHSVGCALILWVLTRNPVISLAGLFHDIATPAFAHVIDFMNEDHLHQESTEEGTKEILSSSAAIQTILKSMGIEIEKVCDYHLYPAADNPAPRLCADRLEYMMGDLFHYHICSRSELEEVFQDLFLGKNKYHEEEIIFQNEEKAVFFARKCLRCSWIFTEDEDRLGMQYLADVLRDALEHGHIAMSDLYTDEPSVIDKLKRSASRRGWEAFCRLNKIEKSFENHSQGWRQIQAKKRYVDPYVAGKGRVSTLNQSFQEELKTFLDRDFSVYLNVGELK